MVSCPNCPYLPFNQITAAKFVNSRPRRCSMKISHCADWIRDMTSYLDNNFVPDSFSFVYLLILLSSFSSSSSKCPLQTHCCAAAMIYCWSKPLLLTSPQSTHCFAQQNQLLSMYLSELHLPSCWDKYLAIKSEILGFGKVQKLTAVIFFEYKKSLQHWEFDVHFTFQSPVVQHKWSATFSVASSYSNIWISESAI